jgi:hypothetical protein
MNKPEEYRGIPRAQELLDLYEQANGKPAETIEDLIMRPLRTRTREEEMHGRE